jgi:uncharacterized membrane protein YdbT with pleckstrin-like domain
LIGIITFPLLGIPGIIYLITVDLIRRGHKYYITDKRAIHEFTFISRKISSVFYDKIQDLHFTQGVIWRAFNIGTVELNTAGGYHVEMEFTGVKNPVQVKRLIEQYMIKRRS